MTDATLQTRHLGYTCPLLCQDLTRRYSSTCWSVTWLP